MRPPRPVPVNATHVKTINASRVGKMKIDRSLARGMSVAQMDRVDAYEWKTYDVPPLTEIATPDSSLGYLGQCAEPLAVYLYATGDFSDADELEFSTRDFEFVWDTRPASGLSFPCEIESSKGVTMRIRAVTTTPVFDWPVQRGERVFIDLTDTRVAQLALINMDRMQAVEPEAFAAAVRCLKGGTAEMRQHMEDYLREQSRPDLVHVTAGLLDEIAQRQAFWRQAGGALEKLLEGLEARVTGPAPTNTKPPASRASADDVAEYQAIALSLLRGDVGADGPIADALGLDISKLDRSGDGFLVAVHDHYDHEGQRLDHDAWGGMRSDTAAHVLYAGRVANESSREYEIAVTVEWCGLRFSMRGSTDKEVRCDVGAAVFFRIVPTRHGRAGRSKSPQFMLRFWGVDEGIRAASEYGESLASDPGDFAREAVRMAERAIRVARRAR